MKTLCFLLLTGCSTLVAKAQWQDSVYGILSQGFDMMFVHNPGRVFDVTFPYTTSTQSGTQTFHGSIAGTFRPQVPMFDLFDLGCGYGQSTVYFAAGVYRTLNNDYAAFVRGGYDYTFTYRWFSIRPGLDLVGLMANNESMGAIDNQNRTVDLFNHESGPTFEVTSTDDNGVSYTNDYDTYHLNIEYRRSSLDISPKIAFNSKTVGRRVFFSLEAGWLLPLYQNSRLRINQVAGDGTPNTLCEVPLHTNGSVGGVYVGAHVSVIVGRRISYRS
jgi:hypothetical protein